MFLAIGVGGQSVGPWHMAHLGFCRCLHQRLREGRRRNGSGSRITGRRNDCEVNTLAPCPGIDSFPVKSISYRFELRDRK